MLVLISLSLIFALGVMTSIAQEKQIRDFLKSKVMTSGAHETWKSKFFNHVTKVEGLLIPDAEGHWVGTMVREGVTIFENGELAWHRAVAIFDGTEGVGSFTQYGITTFQDGSTITGYTNKGTSGGPTAKWTGEIIHGTGRFQGINGTGRYTANMLPLEKGEIAPKSVGEGTMTFTLPSK